MRENIKTIIYSILLVVLIALIAIVLTNDIDLKAFRILSIKGITETKQSLDITIAENIIQEANYLTEMSKLNVAKNNYDVAKEKFDNITDSTIEAVEDATMQEDYFIEYLWINLGHYAKQHSLDIDITTVGDVNATASATTQKTEQQTENQNQAENQTENKEETQEDDSLKSGVRLTVRGRYANVADFIFDVENDKELKFKLDNIKMAYDTSDDSTTTKKNKNKIVVTFDILNLDVVK